MILHLLARLLTVGTFVVGDLNRQLFQQDLVHHEGLRQGPVIAPPPPPTTVYTPAPSTGVTPPPTQTPTTTYASTSPTIIVPPPTMPPTSTAVPPPSPPTTSSYGSGGQTMAPGPAQKPNIVIFIADDLGHMDNSFASGSLQTPTPNIDKLAWDGIILNRHYGNPVCSPTRSAFMTGKYVFHLGMQSNAIAEGEPFGLPLQFPIQPQLFKTLGYSTWFVGKWHLGSFTRQYFPTARGFDYSYGIMEGGGNWFNYTIGWITPVPNTGRMFRENGLEIPWNNTNNAYLPELCTSKAEQLIRNADPNTPFYLYFGTPAVHNGYDSYTTAQHTMPEYQLRPPVLQFSDAFAGRKRQLGIVQVLDESFKRVTDALVNKGVMNNTILVYFADNGAPMLEMVNFIHGANYGKNWPLRQGKGSLFEGGVRTLSFIWSPLLKKRGRITNQLFHITDWFPTLWEAAGGDPAQLPANGDGFSHWTSFQSGLPVGPRKEVVLNIDVLNGAYAAITTDSYGGMYKLLGGNTFDNSFLGWNRPEGTVAGNDSWRVFSPAEVNCNFPEGVEVSPCLPYVSDCLFDLINDPCESNNIAASFPSMLQLLQQKIKTANLTSFPSVQQPFDPASLPTNWDGWWVPWLDPVPRGAIPYAPFQLSSAT